MSITNFILKILNMKDEKIIFNEKSVEECKFREKRCLFFLVLPKDR